MTMGIVDSISPYADLVTFFIGLPVVLATYYQSFKTRQEARRAREGRLHSQDCLEFVAGDGDCINLVPLETLHSLPRAGDVILLPGKGVGERRFIFPVRTWWSLSSISTRPLTTRAAGRSRRG